MLCRASCSGLITPSRHLVRSLAAARRTAATKPSASSFSAEDLIGNVKIEFNGCEAASESRFTPNTFTPTPLRPTNTGGLPDPTGPYALELHADWLRAPLGEGYYGDFHHRWLRHNCDTERHPKTGERTLCSSEIPDDVRPQSVKLVGDALEVEWLDGKFSRYSLSWLRANAYALNRQGPSPPKAEVATITLDPGLSLDEQVSKAMDRVKSYGAAVVRRDPNATGAVEDETEPIISAFEKAGYGIVWSHFGRIEDLRTDNTTNKNTDQLGYTDAAIDLHTDQPFIQTPPRYQMLHGIRQADKGGVSLLADAKMAFEYLESTDANAAELLLTVPVKFHRKQKDFESTVVTPLIVRDGDKFQVRASYFTLAPHALPFSKMTNFYRAHDKFFRLLRDPRHHYRALLGAGDWLIYDNHRALHARTGFSGARWLRGIYFDPISK